MIVDSVLGITNGLIQRQGKGDRTPGLSPNPSAVSDQAADSAKGTVTVPALERTNQNNLSPDMIPPALL